MDKDTQLIWEAYNSEDSIGDMLYELLNSLDPSARTRSGANVSDILNDIINELNDIVIKAESTTNNPEVKQLVQKLKMD